MFDDYVYLPLTYGLLKSYSEADNEILHNFMWLEPIYRSSTIVESLNNALKTRVDILALGCYLWNSKTIKEIIKSCREKNPNCFIILGGPDAESYLNRSVNESQEVNLFLNSDSEESFKLVLKEYLKKKSDYESIPGVTLPQNYLLNNTEQPIKIESFQLSPWLNNSKYYQNEILNIKKNPENLVVIPWETDRGCPYGCSFCNWGGNVLSKVRKVNLDILKEMDMHRFFLGLG